LIGPHDAEALWADGSAGRRNVPQWWTALTAKASLQMPLAASTLTKTGLLFTNYPLKNPFAH